VVFGPVAARPVVTVTPRLRATSATATELPFTGSDPVAPLGISLILLGAGVATLAGAGALRPVR
jgi:hypothetical protein